MSIQESIQLKEKDGIAFVEFDLVGEKVNKLSTPVMMRFKEVVEELKKSSFKAVVLKSNKPGIFIAGADIEEIKKLKTKEDFKTVIDQAHQIFNDFEDLPMPTVAVVNGACMGGGCELILTCDYRVCSDDKSTKIVSKKYKKLENVTKRTNIQRNRTKFGQFGARRVRGTCLEGSRTQKKSKKGQILGFWG